jgi:hypothetical protein
VAFLKFGGKYLLLPLRKPLVIKGRKREENIFFSFFLFS